MTAFTRYGFAAVVAVLAATLATGNPAVAQTINKCQAAKKKCVVKKTKGLLTCHAKAELKNVAVDSVCVNKAVTKFSDPVKGCFVKLEAKGGCLTTGDTGTLESKVDAFVLDVVQELDPGYPTPVLNKCSAAKKKCVMKKTSGLLGCHAKAEKTGTLDPACISKYQTKFADPTKGCMANAEAKPPCLTTGDTATIEQKVDAFVDDVVCELDPSTPGVCPSGVVIAAGDDTWLSPPAGGSYDDFSGSPIPAGFFDPGSDPFSGVVNLRGVELATNPPDALGSVDTIIRRLAPSSSISIGGQATVPIEIVALSLVSVQPITVTYNGGMTPEAWTVRVNLSSIGPQQPGNMTIQRTYADGGTFDSTLPVRPKFTFTRVSDSAVRVLDCGGGGCGPPIVLQGTGSQWTLVGGPAGYDPAEHGIDPVPPGTGVDGDGNGTFETTIVGSSNFRAGVNLNNGCILTEEDALLAKHDVLPPCKDHYKLYVATGTNPPVVVMVDQFQTQVIDLGNLEFFMNPAKKQCATCAPARIAAPDDHLACYDIPGGLFSATVFINNQFGHQTIGVGNPNFLAVPSEKAVGPLPPSPVTLTINHYKCYDANGPPLNIPANLTDQFGPMAVNILAPIFFCNPVSKNGEAMTDPLAHLTCYQFTPNPPFNQPVNIRNQFGPAPATIMQPIAVCVPTKKLGFF